MKPGHLYELTFPYEEGPGGKRRPVLILVINDVQNKALGLKVTTSGPSTSFPHRYQIRDSPHSNLRDPSYIQYDHYHFFDNQPIIPRGQLSDSDFAQIVILFQQFHMY
jgi:hypothetical protein